MVEARLDASERGAVEGYCLLLAVVGDGEGGLARLQRQVHDLALAVNSQLLAVRRQKVQDRDQNLLAVVLRHAQFDAALGGGERGWGGEKHHGLAALVGLGQQLFPALADANAI